MPLVSIVIPTFNRANLLAETLNSVLDQTFQDFEVLVSDDGSTDHTQAVVSAYGTRVRYLRQDNRGHEGATRNLGIRSATGDFIACVDSDDLWAPTKLDRQIRALSANPKWGMTYSDAWCFDSNTGRTLYHFHQLSTPYSGNIARRLIMRDFIPCPSPLVRRAVLEDVGYFSEEPLLRMRSDWDLWLRIAGRYEVGLVREALVGYRLHDGSESRREDAIKCHHSCLAVIHRAAAYEPEVYGSVQRRAIAAQFMHTGGMLVDQGRVTEARSYYAAAVQYDSRLWPAYCFLAVTMLGERTVPTLANFYSLCLRNRSIR